VKCLFIKNIHNTLPIKIKDMSEFEHKNTPITYLVWVLLWVNAIKDSYLWVDAPDCFFFKNDYIQWNHDITSRLRHADWNHKILSTIADADNVVWDRKTKFVQTLKMMAEKDFVKQVFTTSMPMSQIIWTDYEWVIRDVNEIVNKPIFNIPSRSMTDCWIDWYADLLFSLAKNINVEWWNTKKENIAIIWNLFDRWEWDCIWNVNELRRIIESLWLNCLSIWLDWWNYDEILKIKDAGTIISLPYWRKAAKKMAKRLNADLLELDLPFGFDKTWEFINSIAKHFNILEKAENFIRTELTEYNKIDIIKWAIPHTFIWKKIAFYWDPYLLVWIIDFSKTLGFSVENIIIHWDEKHLKNNLNLCLDDINSKNWLTLWINDIDLFITNSNGNWWMDYYKKMQFGFPSYDYHVYAYEPYFWYKGALIFINRIANILNNK
jgi:nitrogenase molybdenum-iron protein alpha/beta subunit